MQRRSVLGFIAVLALAFAAVMVPARAADQQIRTDVIKLKFVRPAQVMYMLGLYSMEDALQGKRTGWTKGQPISAKDSLVPDGVEFIMPYAPDKSLVVKGDAEGIEELRALIGKLDIKPRHIALTIDVWKLTPDQAKSLGITQPSDSEKSAESPTIGYCGKRTAAELRTSLAELHISPVATLSVTTENNVPATIAVDAGFRLRRVEFTVVPRINNADQSITMFIKSPVSPGFEITRRVASGEGIVSYQPAAGEEEGILSLIVPKALN